LPVETVALRGGQNFTGFYQFDSLVVRRWIPGVRGLVTGLQINGDDGDPIVLAANGHGWRDFSHTLEKPLNTFRIVVIGDSFGEPWRRPLEEGISYQLETWLNSQTLEQRVEVINLSISGNNPVDYSLLVNYEAPRYNPDLIVVLLFTVNDVLDDQFVDLLTETSTVDGRIGYSQEWIEHVRSENEIAMNSPAEDGSITWSDLEAAQSEGRAEVTYEASDGTRSYQVRLEEPRLAPPPGFELHCFMQRISRLYTWVKERVRIINDTSKDRERILKRTRIYQSPPDSTMQAGWALYEHLLTQMAGDAADHEIKIVFVTLANGDQVYPEILNQELMWVNQPLEAYDINYPNLLTENICERHNLRCWFMLPVFQEAIRMNVQLFDNFDPNSVESTDRPPVWGHYTPFGYRLVAQAIGKRVLDNSWIHRMSV
jgi:hypothetical protein